MHAHGIIQAQVHDYTGRDTHARECGGRGIFMISAALRTDARAYVYVNGSIRGYCGMHCSVLLVVPFVAYPYSLDDSPPLARQTSHTKPIKEAKPIGLLVP